ncbi:MAG: DUF3108 domain-containing protein [Geminicoccaceae bacterium]|nr:DUF3108 domain-containing protein [Geminicoccaceae bacterium]
MIRVTRRISLAGLIAACGGLVSVNRTPQAFAAGSSLDYSMLVGGVEIAEISLDFQSREAETRVHLSMGNRGIATWIAGRNRTVMRTLLLHAADGGVMPLRFEAVYEKPDRTRETELLYGPNGEISDVQIRHRGHEVESKVPDELRNGAVDPLTALVRMQAWLEAGPPAGDEMVIAVFEGRKRANLHARYEGASDAGEERRLAVSLEGLFGFDRGDALVSMPGEPLRWLDVRVAAGQGRPVILSVSDPLAPVATVIELRH